MDIIPSWISNYIHNIVWDEIIHSQTSTDLSFIGLEVDKQFHPTLYDLRKYFSMLGLDYIYFGKQDTRTFAATLMI